MKALVRYFSLVILYLCIYSNVFAQTWLKVSSGGYFSVALRSDGKIFESGDNSDGQLGQGNYTGSNTFIQVGGDTDWVNIAAGGYHVLALKRNGTLWGWGDNTYGQAGNVNSGEITTQAQIGTDTDWVYISASYRNSYAIKKNGSIWVWGGNGSGQIGNGNTRTTSIPQEIDSHIWKKIGGGFPFTVGLRADGTLWSWGGNQSGQLGNGTYSNSLEPVEIGTDTDWADVSSGFNFTLALKQNGSIWSWGYNKNGGELGLGDTVTRLIPIQIGTANDWAHIYAGSIFAFASKNDSTLYAWGYNYYGELGNGWSNEQSTPEQIGNGHSWITLAPACGIVTNGYIEGQHTLGLDGSANTICVTGDDKSGQLGSRDTLPIDQFNCSVGSITGIENITTLSQICNIYPNPTTGKINIDLVSPISGDNALTLSDMNGKIIYSDYHFNSSSTIDISTYPNGIYLLRIISSDGVYCTKVVKE